MNNKTDEYLKVGALPKILFSSICSKRGNDKEDLGGFANPPPSGSTDEK
jgi:hypothetical protein